MATTAWIESAAHEHKPVIGGGIESTYQHTLVMARADEEHEAEDRLLASRAVQRLAGDDAAEVLAMLDLDAAPEPERDKRCSDCEQVKPQSEFYHRKARPGASEPYCRPCSYARVKAWRASRAQREVA